MNRSLSYVQDTDQQGTIVVEFSVSFARALQMVVEDDHTQTQLRDPADDEAAMEAEPVRCRIVMSTWQSRIEVFYQDTDAVGDPAWEGWSDGVCFKRFPRVCLYRRMILAEMFRRLARRAETRVALAPSGARIIQLDAAGTAPGAAAT